MNAVVMSIFIIIFTVEFIVGNLGNILIAVLYYMDWATRRKISLADKILTGLAVSRIAFIWVTFVSICLLMHNSGFLNIAKPIALILFPWTVATHFCIWFATCLSIFYFFKIANFSNSAFLYLKWRIKKVISVTLLASLVILCANITLLNKYNAFWVNRYIGNVSFNSNFSSYELPSKYFTYFSFSLYFIPFQVSLTAFLLLIFSLWKHLKKMQHNAKGCRDAGTVAHMKALQAIVTFLLLYTIFFISQVVQVWSSNFENNVLIIFICQAAGMAFPVGHSCVLILGNSKLWQAFLSTVWWLRGKANVVKSLVY